MTTDPQTTPIAPVPAVREILGTRDEALDPSACGGAFTARWLADRFLDGLSAARDAREEAERLYAAGLSDAAREGLLASQGREVEAQRYEEKLRELAVGSYVTLHCPLPLSQPGLPDTERIPEFRDFCRQLISGLDGAGELKEREELFTARNARLLALWKEWEAALLAAPDPEALTYTEHKHLWQPRFDALYDDYLRACQILGERAKAWHVRRGAPSPRRTPIPLHMSQQTGQAIRTVNAAFGDAAALRRWAPVEGRTALRHVIDNWPMQTLLTTGQALSWWGREDTLENLCEELSRLGLEGVFLVNVLIGLSLQEGQVTIAMDELIRAVGRGDEARRSRTDRERVEREVWRAILLFDALALVGQPVGRYRTRDTKETIDVSLTGTESLIKITGMVPGQTTLDASAPPAYFSYVCGPWIERMRGNRQVLTEFGDIMRLARLPAGKVAGAWAKSVGLNLNQRWRERSHRAQVTRVGEMNRLTTQFSVPFTRRDLLMSESLCRAAPDPQEMLDGSDPARAKKYWDDAIQILQREAGLISHYREIDPLPARRKGWQNDWLDQPLDIRPNPESMQSVAEIAQSGAAARRTRGTRKTKPG